MQYRRLLYICLLIVGLQGCGPWPLEQATEQATSEPIIEITQITLDEPTPEATPDFSAPPDDTITIEEAITEIPPLQPLDQETRSAIFDRIWSLVDDRYVYSDFNGLDWDNIYNQFAPEIAAAEDPEEFYYLLYMLIDQLGDEHSQFQDPRDVAYELQEFEGELRYAGIGATVRDTSQGGLVVKLARGGPAEEGGLQLYDLITAVNHKPYTDTALFGPDGPISEVRGEPGTTVTITVQRNDTQEIEDLVLERRAISSDAFAQVEGFRMGEDNIGFLRIDTFYLNAIDQRIQAEIENLLEGGPLTGLIIDVRNNGGGRVDLMLSSIGLFIDGGSIGTTSSRNRDRQLHVPTGRALSQIAEIPIVILVSEGTASAAEMFAAGMRVLGQARIVGTPSSGNTENLIPHDLEDGSRLWLAEMIYRLPDGSEIEGSGVKPDRVVEAEWWQMHPDKDPQISAAIEELQNAPKR
jgi:carboxyl-terminal processing protease